MTVKNELTNMVEDFCKAATEKISELNKQGTKAALVLSFITTNDDEDGHHNLRCVAGRRMDVFQAISDLDETDDDGDNLISDYQDFKAWRTRRMANKVHRDLMRMLDEHIEELKKELEEQQSEEQNAEPAED